MISQGLNSLIFKELIFEFSFTPSLHQVSRCQTLIYYCLDMSFKQFSNITCTLSHKSSNFTFHSLSCTDFCKTSQELGETDDQDLSVPGAGLNSRVENRGRDDGVGPQYVSGKFITEHLRLMMTCFPSVTWKLWGIRYQRC